MRDSRLDVSSVASLVEELSHHRFVVFCHEHYNPLGVVRTLGEWGIRPSVIVLEGGVGLVSKSRYVGQLCKATSLDEGFERLMSFCEVDSTPPFVLTSDDTITSYLDCRYDELQGKAYFFNAGADGRVTSFMDKASINNLAIACGLNVLPSETLECGQLPNQVGYPLITKAIDPTMEGWKRDMHICSSQEDLIAAFRTIQSERILVQRYIRKKNELCLEGISTCCGRDFAITVASSYDYYLPMSYSPHMHVGNFDNDELKETIGKMIRAIGFEGIFEVEFLVDQDESLWFSEINFRNSTWSYASTRAGMPLPLIWAGAMLQHSVPRSCLCRVCEGFSAIEELTDYRTRVAKGSMSPAAWLKDLRHADCLYYYAMGKDLRPLASLAASIVKRKISNSIHSA